MTLTKLKELAKAAQGRPFYNANMESRETNARRKHEQDMEVFEARMKLIAACSPETILGLVELIEKMEPLMRRAREVFYKAGINDDGDLCEDMSARVKEMMG